MFVKLDTSKCTLFYCNCTGESSEYYLGGMLIFYKAVKTSFSEKFSCSVANWTSVCIMTVWITFFILKRFIYILMCRYWKLEVFLSCKCFGNTLRAFLSEVLQSEQFCERSYVENSLCSNHASACLLYDCIFAFNLPTSN